MPPPPGHPVQKTPRVMHDAGTPRPACSKQANRKKRGKEKSIQVILSLARLTILSTLHLVQLCQVHSKDFDIEVEIQRRMTRARVYPDTSQELFLYNLQQNRSQSRRLSIMIKDGHTLSLQLREDLEKMFPERRYKNNIS